MGIARNVRVVERSERPLSSCSTDEAESGAGGPVGLGMNEGRGRCGGIQARPWIELQRRFAATCPQSTPSLPADSALMSARRGGLAPGSASGSRTRGRAPFFYARPHGR
jgi:hypothetical protein